LTRRAADALLAFVKLEGERHALEVKNLDLWESR